MTQVSHKALTADSLAKTHSDRWSHDDGPFTPLALRTYRSISWIRRAEQEYDPSNPNESDPDAAFVFYWIAFNAAYASEIDDQNIRERAEFEAYFDKILKLDRLGTTYNAIWEKFKGPIRLLLDNKYLFRPFWQNANGKPGFEDWEKRFSRDKCRVHAALGNEDTRVVLSVLFNRLYTLRNQLVHGGATWKGSKNRDTVKDGVSIMHSLVPIFVNLMMSSPEDTDWGAPYYPLQPE